MRLSANQFVLLKVLDEAIHPSNPPLFRMFPPRRWFASQREWLRAAHALYLKLWPGGSNPERGPRGAIRSVVRQGWVVQVIHGHALVPVLTAVGADVIASVDAAALRPKHVHDFLADIRRRRGELGLVVLTNDTNKEHA